MIELSTTFANSDTSSPLTVGTLASLGRAEAWALRTMRPSGENTLKQRQNGFRRGDSAKVCCLSAFIATPFPHAHALQETQRGGGVRVGVGRGAGLAGEVRGQAGEAWGGRQFCAGLQEIARAGDALPGSGHICAGARAACRRNAERTLVWQVP